LKKNGVLVCGRSTAILTLYKEGGLLCLRD
jgi:hypothetical protein